jgi:hypothetical protein
MQDGICSTDGTVAGMVIDPKKIDLSKGYDIANPPDVAPTPALPTMPALDENSGAYHVTRQYGDIYLYNDGNIIAWGGNGKNFSFGNGYEENHAWANLPCVYNQETFQIPNGAMSSFTDPKQAKMLPTTPPDTNWEWLGGNVSKSWGNDYSYSFGRSYEWSGGPATYIDAFGNSGDAPRDVMANNHCTFSYGTGYEEALIEWREGDPYFHADDASSPYKGKVNDDWASSNLGATWLAGNLLVSKAFGPTFDYHYGPTKSIQEGPSEEHVNGASWSYVNGDSNETVNGSTTETVTGDSNSTVTGDATENVTGNLTSMVKGNSVEQRWGGAAEFFMGGKSEMILAACDEITLSVKVEIKTLGAVEVFAGASLAVYLGLLVEAQAGTKIEVSQLKVKAHDAKVTAAAAAAVQVAGAAMVAASPVNLTTP